MEARICRSIWCWTLTKSRECYFAFAGGRAIDENLKYGDPTNETRCKKDDLAMGQTETRQFDSEIACIVWLLTFHLLHTC